MSLVQTVERVPARVESGPSRYAYADNLKVLLVVGVIVGHATMAWIENDAWVLEEPAVRDPLYTLLNLAALVGVPVAMPLFFLIGVGYGNGGQCDKEWVDRVATLSNGGFAGRARRARPLRQHRAQLRRLVDPTQGGRPVASPVPSV